MRRVLFSVALSSALLSGCGMVDRGAAALQARKAQPCLDAATALAESYARWRQAGFQRRDGAGGALHGLADFLRLTAELEAARQVATQACGLDTLAQACAAAGRLQEAAYQRRSARADSDGAAWRRAVAASVTAACDSALGLMGTEE